MFARGGVTLQLGTTARSRFNIQNFANLQTKERHSSTFYLKTDLRHIVIYFSFFKRLLHRKIMISTKKNIEFFLNGRLSLETDLMLYTLLVISALKYV